MLAGEGLHPSLKAKRIKFSGGNRIVTDGPYAGDARAYRGFLDLESEFDGRSARVGEADTERFRKTGHGR